MMGNKKQKKSNNALSLGKMIINTKKNMEEAEISKEFADDVEELENLEDKNARRSRSIYEMEKQLKERAQFQARKDSFR